MKGFMFETKSLLCWNSHVGYSNLIHGSTKSDISDLIDWNTMNTLAAYKMPK